jgi:DNA-binding NarL/FixJ family response regulator
MPTTTATTAITILLADDHCILRDGLRSLLRAEPDFRVVAEAADGREAVRLAAELSPDVVVMDLSMPHLNGIEATRQILAHHPRTKVVALSVHSDLKLMARCFRAGASGYLPKEVSFEELTAAIRTAADGRTYLSPMIAPGLLQELSRPGGGDGNGNGDGSAFDRLTTREREVLQLVSEGLPTKRIAAELDVSVKTVETHRRTLMEKTGLFSIAELTKLAIREGLTTAGK